jgi:DNA mismatch repair protein MutL
MSTRIHKLDPLIANQIAAGEVIERPANAVKELVENALDAGATRVTIDIEDGGKKLIRVRDDGSGMEAGDAVLSLQRHATSKLRSADDLFAISTLGFRGEALPSIAAVSRLELTTLEPHAESGVRLRVEAGEVLEIEEIGTTPGTDIVIRSLFFNTPARFKFLKSDSAEAGRIAEMIGHLALAYPHVAFRLKHNGTELLRCEAGGNAFNAVVSVLGREVARQMLPIAPSSEAATSEVKVAGFVGSPRLTRANRNAQIFYVNGRVVKNRALQHAVQAAYEGLIHGGGRHPVAVIFISLPTNAVDVNVHPTKSEVRFAREWEVHHAVRLAIRETLVASQVAPDWNWQGGNQNQYPPAPQSNGGEQGGVPSVWPAMPGLPRAPLGNTPLDPSTSPASWDSFSRGLRPDFSNSSGGDFDPDASHGTSNSSTPPPPVPNTWQAAPTQQVLAGFEEPEEKKMRLRPLAQISNNAYILCEADDGLYIVCQHRAHEKILADRAITAAAREPVPSQRLVIPFTSEVGPRVAGVVEENAALIRELGFEVEAFGGNSLLVRGVPVLVANKDYEVAFADLLDELAGGAAGRDLDARRKKLLTMLACKNSIKAGDPLPAGQMQQLVDDLLELPNPSICPHGQPILIRITTLELDKKFEREYSWR